MAFRSPFDEPCDNPRKNPKMHTIAMDVGEGYQAIVSLPSEVTTDEFQQKYEEVVDSLYEKYESNWKYADAVVQTVEVLGGKVISAGDGIFWLIIDP